MTEIPLPPPAKSLGTKVIRGAFWTIGMRWLSRFMGLISMVFIARLLTPVDFGIIAVTSALVGLLESFTDLGVDTALIRHPKPLRKHYDTAWTLSMLIHIVVAALIAITGFFSPYLYSDTRYAWVLYVMSLAMFINGLSNVGCVDFRRNLDYHKDFQINLSTQLVGVICTLALAFKLHSYWALALGILVRSITRLLLSFLMHPYRPRFSLAASREMIHFSFWMMVRSVAIFLTNKADRLVLAAYFSPALIGLYTIANELASMAVFELLHPLGRVLLPALSSKQDDPEWLEQNIQKIFNITATIAVASGVGLAAIAEPVLTLIYGTKYSEAAPMLILLSLLNVIGGFNQPIGQLLLLMNKAREFALIFMFEGIATLILIFILSENHYDLKTIIYGRIAVTLLAFFRLFYLLRTFKTLRLLTILSAWIRPVTAGICMFIAIHFCQLELSRFSTKLVIPLSIFVGASTFITVLLILWYLMKKPDSIEYAILSRLKN